MCMSAWGHDLLTFIIIYLLEFLLCTNDLTHCIQNLEKPAVILNTEVHFHYGRHKATMFTM